MRIVTIGRKPQTFGWAGRYRCPRCTSVYDVTEDDAMEVQRNWITGNQERSVVTLYCQVCEETRTLIRVDDDEETP